MEVLRKYGTAASVFFPLIDNGAQDFESTPVTFVATDCQISKDGGAFANTGCIPWHVGNGIYAASLTAAEMQAKCIVMTIVDAATKAWEDQAIVITTYGASTAQHSLDIIADHVIRRTYGEAASSSDGATKDGRSLIGVIAKHGNKVAACSGTLYVYEEDDATQLFTQTIDSDSGADPIVELDTA